MIRRFSRDGYDAQSQGNISLRECIVAPTRNLRCCHLNVGIKSHFTANIVSPQPALLKSTVRTSGFNSLEWPLYGFLSILILLTVAIVPPPHQIALHALARDPTPTGRYVVRL